MKFNALTIAATAAIALFTTACAEAPVAPFAAMPAGAATMSLASQGVEREVIVDVYDLSDSMTTWSCDGEENEYVRLHGRLILKETRVELPNGFLNIRLNAMGDGLGGIGMTSGDEYRYVEDQKGVWNLGRMGGTQTWSQSAKLINTRTKEGFTMTYFGTFVVNANGELTVDRLGARTECALQ